MNATAKRFAVAVAFNLAAMLVIAYVMRQSPELRRLVRYED